MGFFAGSVDLTSPGPIGSTTPNTGAFTTLSATPPANTTAINSTGFSLTGTNAQTLLNLAGTWNTSGTPAAFKLNITDTASNSSSVLMDLQVGGVSKISVRKDGVLIGPAATNFQIQSDTNIYFRVNGGSANGWINGTNGVVWRGYLGIHSSNGGGAFEVAAHSGGSNIWEQRNSTNAQTFRLYNTYTDASNYERGFFRWSSNILELGAEAAGTGTQRQLRFPLGTVTASTPLSITQTWNGSGVTFTGIQANITDTASASASLLMDLQVAGSSKFYIDKAGTGFCGVIRASNALFATGGGVYSNSAIYLGSAGSLFWKNNTTAESGTADLSLSRDAANILAQRNSTNAQTFRLYRTYTDASNYERLGLLTTNTTRYTITSQNAGTGSARSLEVSYYTSASDPTSTEITDGCFSVWKNSGTGIIKIWANDGGTMKSIALV